MKGMKNAHPLHLPFSRSLLWLFQINKIAAACFVNERGCEFGRRAFVITNRNDGLDDVAWMDGLQSAFGFTIPLLHKVNELSLSNATL